MPYIPQADRAKFDEAIDTLPVPETAGELNYLLTRIFHDYWKANGRNYQAFNDILGAADGSRLELYRRFVAPYEETKIVQNGDVRP